MSILNLIEDVEAYSVKMKPSFNIQGKPAYRIDKKSPCFIGNLISDEHYKESFEGIPIHQLALKEDFAPVIKELKKKYALKSTPALINTLVTLQEIHDALSPLTWKDEFATLKAKRTPKAGVTSVTIKVPEAPKTAQTVPVNLKSTTKATASKQKAKVVSPILLPVT